MFRFATKEDIKELMPLFFSINSAIINNGWTITQPTNDKLQVRYKKGEKEFDILPLYDAHIEPDNEWCFEAMRHDCDLDICYITTANEIPYLLDYINQEGGE